MLINDDVRHSHTIAIKARGNATTATLVRLTAPSAQARTGVSISGLTLGKATTTGRATGRQRLYTITPTNGEYVVRVPAASAALLVR